MRILLRSIACTVAVLTACAGGPVGREFPAERALLQAVGDCVVIGSFDVRYPARVVDVDVADREAALRFEHRSTPHEYPAMPGCELRAVYVEHAAGRGVLVLSSKPEA